MTLLVKNKLLIPLLAILISLILIGLLSVIVIPSVARNLQINNLEISHFVRDDIIISWLQRTGILQTSSAQVLIDGQSIKIQFKITQADLPKAQQFSQSLGTDNRWLQGISLELDSNSLNKLNNILPMKADLRFDQNRISFKSQTQNSLNSSLAGKTYQLATLSSSLNLNLSSESEFSLKIVDPAPLLNYATTSGQLSLSSKLDRVFPLLNKIAKIDIKVNGKNMEGEVLLK